MRFVVAPAAVADAVKAEATALALRVADEMGFVGILAIEMFLDTALGGVWRASSTRVEGRPSAFLHCLTTIPRPAIRFLLVPLRAESVEIWPIPSGRRRGASW